MFQALLRTITEILDSKKAAYSFIAVIGASVLHLYFGVSIADAMLLMSPLGVATLSQAHVDASAARQPKPAPAAPVTSPATPGAVDPVPTPIAPDPAPAPPADAPKTEG